MDCKQHDVGFKGQVPLYSGWGLKLPWNWHQIFHSTNEHLEKFLLNKFIDLSREFIF